MSLYKLFFAGFIGCAAFSLVAMDEKKAEYSKSVKWPMFALKQTDIPQELRQMILQQYVHVSLDDKAITEMKELLSSSNDQHNGAKINIADLMWLDIQDKKKLVLAKNALDYMDRFKDPNDPSSRLIGRIYHRPLTKEEYKNITSLPLYLRRKLEGSEVPRNVAVVAGQYDLEADEKNLLFDHVFNGAALSGTLLYGATGFGVGFGELSVFGMCSWYLAGAGFSGIGSYLNTMKKKCITPPKPWATEKLLCPEMVSQWSKLYSEVFPGFGMMIQSGEKMMIELKVGPLKARK